MHRVLALVVCAIWGFHRGLAADSVAAAYLSRLDEVLGRAGANMPAITKSAEAAAGDFLSGGNLWAAGRQADFVSDACVRVPGYDVPILPASGVIQAAIYWALASERVNAVP